MKVIKISMQGRGEFPDKAEIIRFKDETGEVSDHVKLNGKLFRPALCWFEYKGSEPLRKVYGEKFASGGISLEMVDDDSHREFFPCPEHEKWYLEEMAEE